MNNLWLGYLWSWNVSSPYLFHCSFCSVSIIIFPFLSRIMFEVFLFSTSANSWTSSYTLKLSWLFCISYISLHSPEESVSLASIIFLFIWFLSCLYQVILIAFFSLLLFINILTFGCYMYFLTWSQYQCFEELPLLF